MQYCCSVEETFPPVTGATEWAWWQSVQIVGVSCPWANRLAWTGLSASALAGWHPPQTADALARYCSRSRNRRTGCASRAKSVWQPAQVRKLWTDFRYAAGSTNTSTES